MIRVVPLPWWFWTVRDKISMLPTERGITVRREFTTNSPEETMALGATLGAPLKGGEIILLRGDLGAGKTLLTKGIMEGLAPGSSSSVVSPSFTLVNIYNARLDIIHVDLYRLDSEEIGNLGLEDFMDKDHVMVVEWAEHARNFFMGDIVEITIDYLGDHSRKITIISYIPWIAAQEE
jgi:tRNA threonylcarbamoyladenosine biosynthesis protein TsaE